MRRRGGLVVWAAAAMLVLAGCPKRNVPTASAYDLPVKTSGGIEDAESKPAVPLTISIETVDPADDPDLAALIENAVAFDHYSDLNACESGAGWETGFQVGSIGVGFVLMPDGSTEEVSLVLSAGGPSEAFTSCLVQSVEAMVLTGVALEAPATLHLMLRYGD
ncbi:MAG: hypothetical protein JRG91_11985 [Deltaproteobacteria bacterium]|nr:hypothetical protein [Deltaproteobacteria bacterium]